MDIRKTHNLTYLIDQVNATRYPLAPALYPLTALNPFAVEYRYDLPEPDIQVPLDRATVGDLVRGLHSWAESIVRREG